MKRIASILIWLCVLAGVGCAASRVEQILEEMIADRQIMLKHPVLTEEHGAARVRFNRDAYELIRLGYFEEKVIPLRHIRQDSPRAEALWDELRTIADPTTHPSEFVWSPPNRYQPERFTIWDTSRNIPKAEAIIKKYDVPEKDPGQQRAAPLPPAPQTAPSEGAR